MIRNIVFDMGNVLIHFCPELLIEQMQIPEEDRPLLLSEVFHNVEWVQLDRGSVTWEDAIRGMCSRLPAHLHDAADKLVRGWWNRPLIPVEGMAGLIREVKSLGYGIYLLSNASMDLPRYFPRIPGSEYFDGMIFSAQWKLLKPQPELYHVLFREYHLKPEECFFIDDLPTNVEGAICVGMPGTVFRDVPSLRHYLAKAGIPVHQ